MRVLYVEHSSVLGGGQRSLLELLAATEGALERDLACPAGELYEQARRAGVACVEITPALISFRPHPVRTPYGLLELARSRRDVRDAARRVTPDLLHANSVRAGLAAVGAAKRPVVVHMRDQLPDNAAGRLVARVLAERCARVVCVSRWVARPFERHLGPERLRVIDNAVDLERFSLATESRGQARDALGLPAEAPILALVAQITPWKGQREAIEVVDTLRASHPDVRLLIVGSAKFAGGRERFDNSRYMREIETLVRTKELERQVLFLGERDDVPRIMRAADLVLVPSWQEPFGRSVAEAMAAGTPVVATTRGGPAEIISDGREGRLVEPRHLDAWVAALDALLADQPARAAMGRAARELALRRFGREQLASAIQALYRELV